MAKAKNGLVCPKCGNNKYDPDHNDSCSLCQFTSVNDFVTYEEYVKLHDVNYFDNKNSEEYEINSSNFYRDLKLVNTAIEQCAIYLARDGSYDHAKEVVSDEILTLALKECEVLRHRYKVQKDSIFDGCYISTINYNYLRQNKRAIAKAEKSLRRAAKGTNVKLPWDKEPKKPSKFKNLKIAFGMWLAATFWFTVFRLNSGYIILWIIAAVIAFVLFVNASKIGLWVSDIKDLFLNHKIKLFITVGGIALLVFMFTGKNYIALLPFNWVIGLLILFIFRAMYKKQRL